MSSPDDPTSPDHDPRPELAACGLYGLPREEFESLPAGPRDRTAGTQLGRQARPAAQKLEAARQGITGTAQLAIPSEVVRGVGVGEAPVSRPPMRRFGVGLWGGLIALFGLLVLLYVLQRDDETRAVLSPGVSAGSGISVSSLEAPPPRAAPASVIAAPTSAASSAPTPFATTPAPLGPAPTGPWPPRTVTSKPPDPAPPPAPPTLVPPPPKPIGSGLIFRPE